MEKKDGGVVTVNGLMLLCDEGLHEQSNVP